MHIVYIHGNRATANSFNFIRAHLPSYSEVVLEYDSSDGFYANQKEMREELQGLDGLFFVGHSLGGIHALHLANELADQSLGGVTLSTPYGGSEAASFVKFVLPFNQVLNDIHPHSAPILQSMGFEIRYPWTNVVTTRGHSPFLVTPNDGVVTHGSMRHREDIGLVNVDTNHYEILLSHEAVNIIKQAIAELEATTG